MKPLVNMNMAEAMKQSANKYGNCTAIFSSKIQYTYSELDDLTDKLAAGLYNLGIRVHDHVAIWAENSVETLLMFYAIEKFGAVACMINTGLTSNEVETLLNISDVHDIIIGTSCKDIFFYKEIASLQKKYPIRNIVNLGSEIYNNCTNYSQLFHHDLDAELKANMLSTDPKSDGLILYTSGTTGNLPKAVVSSYYNLVNGGIQKADAQDITKVDRVCCALQMFHIFAIDVAMMAALTTGATLVIPDSTHTVDILKAIDQFSCTVLSSVPLIFYAMMERDDFHNYNLDSLRTGIVGGAACGPELFRRIDREFNFTLLPGLGQTEATAGIAIASLSDSLEIRSTTVGKFVAHSEGRIVDPNTHSVLSNGAIGEIQLRSPLLMSRYYGQPELTATTINSEGWLHTGDIGWLDDKDYLHLSGRIKDVINKGGEKIIPAEIEDVILKIQGIDQVKVIGIEDPTYGETVCACIITALGIHYSDDFIHNNLVKKIANYKMPKYILFLNEFPLNSTGKIDISRLRNIVNDIISSKPNAPDRL